MSSDLIINNNSINNFFNYMSNININDYNSDITSIQDPTNSRSFFSNIYSYLPFSQSNSISWAKDSNKLSQFTHDIKVFLESNKNELASIENEKLFESIQRIGLLMNIYKNSSMDAESALFQQSSNDLLEIVKMKNENQKNNIQTKGNDESYFSFWKMLSLSNLFSKQTTQGQPAVDPAAMKIEIAERKIVSTRNALSYMQHSSLKNALSLALGNTKQFQKEAMELFPNNDSYSNFHESISNYLDFLTNLNLKLQNDENEFSIDTLKQLTKEFFNLSKEFVNDSKTFVKILPKGDDKSQIVKIVKNFVVGINRQQKINQCPSSDGYLKMHQENYAAAIKDLEELKK